MGRPFPLPRPPPLLPAMNITAPPFAPPPPPPPPLSVADFLAKITWNDLRWFGSGAMVGMILLLLAVGLALCYLRCQRRTAQAAVAKELSKRAKQWVLPAVHDDAAGAHLPYPRPAVVYVPVPAAAVAGGPVAVAGPGEPAAAAVVGDPAAVAGVGRAAAETAAGEPPAADVEAEAGAPAADEAAPAAGVPAARPQAAPEIADGPGVPPHVPAPGAGPVLLAAAVPIHAEEGGGDDADVVEQAIWSCLCSVASRPCAAGVSHRDQGDPPTASDS